MKAATQICHLQTQHLSAKKDEEEVCLSTNFCSLSADELCDARNTFYLPQRRTRGAIIFNLIFSYSYEKNIRKLGCNVVLKI
jgi:hypothetical protein